MQSSSLRLCSALSASQLLTGKTVLVTGGGRGIGRAIALICHGQGADVVITSRTKSELEETIALAVRAGSSSDDDDQEKRERLKRSAMASTLLSRRDGRSPSRNLANKATSVGARRTGTATKARMGRSSVSRLVDAVKTGSSSMATTNTNDYDNNDCDSDTTSSSSSSNTMTYHVCDVTNESQVESMVREIVGDGDDQERGIDILINNAGGAQSPKGPVGTLENQHLEDLLKLNVVGPQLVTSALCKHSKAWGPDSETNAKEQKVILNISSMAGKVGLQNYSFYVASKFALEGLTSSWSKELASRNIRVHSLSPGMVNTKSFPKPAGKQGVREASSIQDCLLLALTGRVPSGEDAATTTTVVEDMMDYTGHYIHVGEYDKVVESKGIELAHMAWKAIDEEPFQV